MIAAPVITVAVTDVAIIDNVTATRLKAEGAITTTATTTGNIGITSSNTSSNTSSTSSSGGSSY